MLTGSPGPITFEICCHSPLPTLTQVLRVRKRPEASTVEATASREKTGMTVVSRGTIRMSESARTMAGAAAASSIPFKNPRLFMGKSLPRGVSQNLPAAMNASRCSFAILMACSRSVAHTTAFSRSGTFLPR